ncbi:hypothetical protein [Azobacteroides phage ProJPt-Bp1]|uniref:Uncharacterized protein n=1 Tax=Azobacteroides phage ProJPt-Bp1 TaxID=1920526 RepID=A0A1V1FY39_9CAUD|nr:hypothetical protein KNT10_gp19 [Azobacteroides phage ProJPt-Bp1]BAX03444.1 hypothetical protein [Azobacteroides phage ProJPt-Bp1]
MKPFYNYTDPRDNRFVFKGSENRPSAVAMEDIVRGAKNNPTFIDFQERQYPGTKKAFRKWLAYDPQRMIDPATNMPYDLAAWNVPTEMPSDTPIDFLSPTAKHGGSVQRFAHGGSISGLDGFKYPIRRYATGGSAAVPASGTLEAIAAASAAADKATAKGGSWGDFANTAAQTVNSSGVSISDMIRNLFRKRPTVGANDYYYKVMEEALRGSLAKAQSGRGADLLPPTKPQDIEAEPDIDPAYMTSERNNMTGVVAKALMDKIKDTDSERSDALERLASRRREAGRAGDAPTRLAMILEAQRQYGNEMKGARAAADASNRDTRAEFARTMAAIGDADSAKAMEASRHNIEEKTRVDDLNARRHAAHRQARSAQNYAYEQEKRAFNNQQRMDEYNRSKESDALRLQLAELHGRRGQEADLAKEMAKENRWKSWRTWLKLLGMGAGATIGGMTGGVAGAGLGLSLGSVLKHGGSVRRYSKGGMQNAWMNQGKDIDLYVRTKKQRNPFR